MKELIKSVLNFETILSCFIGAIGYGVGYNLPKKLGVGSAMCLVYCLILGTVFDLVASKILSTNFFKQSRKNKIIVASWVYASYLIAWMVVYKTLNYDLDNDFLFSLAFVLIVQFVLLVLNMIKNKIKTLKEKN